MVLGTLVTRTRVVGLTALGLIAVVLAISLRASDVVDPGRTAYDLIVGGYSLGLLAPVTALVFASAAFGDLAEDGTLVYLWLKPVARWKLVLAAVGATLTVALPVSVLPATLAGFRIKRHPQEPAYISSVWLEDLLFEAGHVSGFSETAVWSRQPGGCGDKNSPSYQTCYPPAVNYTPLYYLVNGQAFDKTNAANSLFTSIPHVLP